MFKRDAFFKFTITMCLSTSTCAIAQDALQDTQTDEQRKVTSRALIIHPKYGNTHNFPETPAQHDAFIKQSWENYQASVERERNLFLRLEETKKKPVDTSLDSDTDDEFEGQYINRTPTQISFEEIRSDIEAKITYIRESMEYFLRNNPTEEEEKHLVRIAQMNGKNGYVKLHSGVKKISKETAKKSYIQWLTERGKHLEGLLKILTDDAPSRSETLNSDEYKICQLYNDLELWLLDEKQPIKATQMPSTIAYADIQGFYFNMFEQYKDYLPDYYESFRLVATPNLMHDGAYQRPFNMYNTEPFVKTLEKFKQYDWEGKIKELHESRLIESKQAAVQAVIQTAHYRRKHEEMMLNLQKIFEKIRSNENKLAFSLLEISKVHHQFEKYFGAAQELLSLIKKENAAQAYEKLQSERKKLEEEKRQKNIVRQQEERKRAKYMRTLKSSASKFWKNQAREAAKVGAEKAQEAELSQLVEHVTPEPQSSVSKKKKGKSANKLNLQKAKKQAKHEEEKRAKAAAEEMHKKLKEHVEDSKIDITSHFGEMGELSARKKQALKDIYDENVAFKMGHIIPFIQSLGAQVTNNGGSQRTASFTMEDGSKVKGIFHEWHQGNSEIAVIRSVKNILKRAGFLPS